MFALNSAEEEARLDEMQSVWQVNRRQTSLAACFEHDAEQLLTPVDAVVARGAGPAGRLAGARLGVVAQHKSIDDPNLHLDDVIVPPAVVEPVAEAKRPAAAAAKRPRAASPATPVATDLVADHVVLDASSVGDFPACYTVPRFEPHQCPVVGVYIDRRVVPGFAYRIRAMRALAAAKCAATDDEYLFDGRPLCLQAIGRGYARRLTFADCASGAAVHFWSDNLRDGYLFEPHMVGAGDKFTLFDADKEAQGIVEIVQMEGPQVELDNVGTSAAAADGLDCGAGMDAAAGDVVEKRVRVRMIAKVEFYETGVAKLIPLGGVALCSRRRGERRAQITRVVGVAIDHVRYHLVPGLQTSLRRVTVRGAAIGDVPCKYTMTGLREYEIPVVGTYVDPRVVPGFRYRVRPNNRADHLFDGRALHLQSVGMGYAKRLTFEPDSLVDPANYLWSDNHPDGLALEPRALQPGMRFAVLVDREVAPADAGTVDGQATPLQQQQPQQQQLGVASVFRADLPQREERMEVIRDESNPKRRAAAVVKYVHVDVMCHVRLGITGGGPADAEEHLMRVYGLAVVRKEAGAPRARVVRVENIALDSQLNLIFARSQAGLTFVPLP